MFSALIVTFLVLCTGWWVIGNQQRSNITAVSGWEHGSVGCQSHCWESCHHRIISGWTAFLCSVIF